MHSSQIASERRKNLGAHQSIFGATLDVFDQTIEANKMKRKSTNNPTEISCRLTNGLGPSHHMATSSINIKIPKEHKKKNNIGSDTSSPINT